MSAWDDADKQDGQVGGHVDDGFHDHTPNEEGGGHVVDDAALVVKKKGVNPKLVAGILGIVFLGFIAYAGNNVYQRFTKNKARQQAQIEQARIAEASAPVAPSAGAEPTEGSRQPATIMDISPAAAQGVATAPVADMSTGGVAAPASQATVASPAPSAAVVPVTPPPAVAAVVPAATVAPADPRMQAQMEEHAKRLASIEGALAKLAEQGARRQSPAAEKTASALPDKPARAKMPRQRQVAKHSGASRATEAAQPGKPGASIVAGLADARAIDTLSDLPTYQLRGVYPPQGEDRQAWVLDSKTGAITVVSRGSTLQGMRVVSVESDHITTDRGTIR